jgi:hypothetical protein
MEEGCFFFSEGILLVASFAMSLSLEHDQWFDRKPTEFEKWLCVVLFLSYLTGLLCCFLLHAHESTIERIEYGRIV